MKIALWSPKPASAERSWTTSVLPCLEGRAEIVRIFEAPRDPPAVDLHLYEIANDPAHAFAYRAALARPGVVVLRDFGLHDLVAHVGGADAPPSYLREMRRAHGEAGTFVGRQVLRGLGGRLLPSLFAVNDRLLEGSLGVIATTSQMAARAARRLPGRPILSLPLDLLLPPVAAPSREEARRVLGLPVGARVVAVDAEDPETARLPALLRARERLGFEMLHLGPPGLPASLTALAAADVAAALRFPARGGVPEAVVRALEIGRPVLVSAGTPPAEELPEGVVVPVDPDAAEEAEVEALLAHLFAHPELRERISEAARAHLAAARDPRGTADRLLGFLDAAALQQGEALRAIAADRADLSTLLGWAMEEVRWGARDLGLVGVSLGLEPALGDLLGRARGATGRAERG